MERLFNLVPIKACIDNIDKNLMFTMSSSQVKFYFTPHQTLV